MFEWGKFDLQDHVDVEVARLYSIELKEPCFVAVGDHADYDIVSLSRTRRIEVKCETTPARTHNVAIEFWNTSLNRPSGVLGTKADTWLHIVLEGDELVAYEYDVNVLRKLAIGHGVVKSNGRNALCKIIPLDLFKKYAKRSFTHHSRFMQEIKIQGGIEA